MLRRLALVSLTALPLGCSLTGEPNYAARDREVAAREANPAEPEAEAEIEAEAEQPEVATRTAEPSYQGSDVRPTGLRTDSDPAYENNRVSFQINVAGASRSLVIELDPDGAPNNVANFKQNVANGTYDGLQFHRAIPGYLVQSGDPLTRNDSRRSDWGTGGPGYTVPFEQNGSFEAGTVGIARLDDDVNPGLANHGSQFFITLEPQSQLTGNYTVIGQVVEGLDAVRSIASTATDENDAPLQPVAIVDVDLVAGGPAGSSRVTWETATEPQIQRVSGGGSRASRGNDSPRFVGPPRLGTWRSFINRVW